MEDKLILLFDFLSKNRKYNKAYQQRYYHSILSSCNTSQERLISLLYNIAKTQNQPNINYQSEFFKKIFQNIDSLNSFASFITFLKKDEKASFIGLFNAIENQRSWGNKTSALFVKSIYHLHCEDYGLNLKIWDDVPESISENDRLLLPVDEVIMQIFKKLDDKNTWNFKTINKLLGEFYKGSSIEIWDDLWFWGYFTQKVVKDSTYRKFEWNQEKYWANYESDKSFVMMNEVEALSKEFISIIL